MDDLIKNEIDQPYQELFDYLANELNVIALQTQMQEIESIIVRKIEIDKYIIDASLGHITINSNTKITKK